VLQISLLLFVFNVLIRVQVHDEDRLPVSGGSAPAIWTLLLRCFIDDGALLWQRDINAFVALCRRHKPDGAMPMLVVVPLHKPADPLAGGKQIFERLVRLSWPIFHCLET